MAARALVPARASAAPLVAGRQVSLLPLQPRFPVVAARARVENGDAKTRAGFAVRTA